MRFSIGPGRSGNVLFVLGGAVLCIGAISEGGGRSALGTIGLLAMAVHIAWRRRIERSATGDKGEERHKENP